MENPHLSLCIPVYPCALVLLSFSVKKGKNNRKKGKFQGISADFIGILKDNQGGNPFLFVGIREKY